MVVRVAVMVVLLALAAPVAAHAQSDPGCVGDTDPGAVPQKPGPRLRFGITPLAQAGQIGPVPADALPEQPERTNSALAELRPAGAPFVVRLNRFFWSDGEAGVPRLLQTGNPFPPPG